LSVFNRPPKPRILAVLKGYFDDGRTDPKFATPNWVVGGYIGDDHHWKNYNSCWPLVLANHGIEYYHGKEMMRSRGQYQKWHPLHEHKCEINAFIKDLTTVIWQSRLRGFASVVRLS